ncbi:MAG: ABC transporter substrate-binding protein [Huintestinicola sp.]
MNRTAAFLAALIMVFPLAGCGRNNDGSGHTFNICIENNPQNLDPQLAEDKESILIIKNIFGGLMETDENGLTVNGTVDYYRLSDDNLTYTFVLKEDLYWYGYGLDEQVPLTAYDYEYAFRRIYDKETKSPYTDMFSCIKNSMRLYNGDCGADDFGVYAKNEKMLVIELARPHADFLKLLTYSPAMPCNEKLFLSTKGRYGLSYKSTFGCGGFYVADWNYDPYWHENYITLKRINANSHDNYHIYPEGVQIGISDDPAEYASVNGIELDAYISDTAEDDKALNSREYYARTVMIGISPDCPIYSSEDARKALAMVLDSDTVSAELPAGCIRANRILPGEISIVNSAFRNLIPDVPYDFGSRSPSYLWESFCDTLGSSVDINGMTLLVPDSIKAESVPYTVTSMWENGLEFYCTPVFADEASYNAAVMAGEYDLYITEVSADENNAAMFIENAADKCNYPADKAALLAGIDMSKNLTSLKTAVGSAEDKLINEYYALPLYYSSEYLITKEEVEDVYYDPFSGAMMFRSAKCY